MNFTPKILAYVCTYCTYTAADMAGSARMQYPATVRIIKYLCTGRIDIIHILKGLEAGADAIMVSGCEAGSCHFLEGNLRARERVEYTKQLLDEIGWAAAWRCLRSRRPMPPSGWPRSKK